MKLIFLQSNEEEFPDELRKEEGAKLIVEIVSYSLQEAFCFSQDFYSVFKETPNFLKSSNNLKKKYVPAKISLYSDRSASRVPYRPRARDRL